MMTSVMNNDTVTKCRTSPKIVQKVKKTTLPVKQQQRAKTVPLRDKQVLNAPEHRSPVIDLEQSKIYANEGDKSSKLEEIARTETMSKNGNTNENVVIKEKGKTKMEEKNTNVSRKKERESIKKEGNPTKDNVTSKTSAIKNIKENSATRKQTTDSLRTVNAESQTRKSTALRSDTTAFDSRKSKSRSSTPTSVVSTKSSTKATTKSAIKSSKSETQRKEYNASLKRDTAGDGRKGLVKTENSVEKEQITDKIDDSCSRQPKEGRLTRSRSNTPGSSVSSESAVSTKTNKSSSSRSSSGASKASHSSAKGKTVAKEPATKSVQRSNTFVKDESVNLRTHSYMKTTKSSVNRNASCATNDSDSKKQTKPGVIRKVTAIKQSCQMSRSVTQNSVKSGSPNETSSEFRSSQETLTIPDSIQLISPVPDRPQRTSISRSLHVSSQKSDSVHATSVTTLTKRSKSNMTSQIINKGLKQDSEQLEQGSQNNTTIIQKKTGGDSITFKPSMRAKDSKMITQLMRKTPTRELSSKTKQDSSTKSGPSSTRVKVPLKSKSPVPIDTGAKPLTSQKIIPGKCSTNKTGRKNVKTDTTVESKLVKSASLQDGSKIRSKRSSSKEPESLPSSHVPKSSSADKCSSALPVSALHSSGPANKNRDQRQLKTGATESAKPEHKSKLIAPLPKNATNRLSKVSKRDSNISDVSGDISKLKSSRSSVVARVETVPQVKVSKLKSETKKSAGESKTGVVSKKFASCADNKTTTAPKNKSASRVGKHNIKTNLSVNSILSLEKNAAMEGHICKDIRSIDTQVCDLCSGTRNFSDMEVFREKRKPCHCSPISQNNTGENNQCSSTEKMELSETSCVDVVNVPPRSRDTQNHSRNDNVERNGQVSMDTESANILACSDMQIHQHVKVGRCDFMYSAVSEHTLAENVSGERGNNGEDCVDGVYIEKSVCNSHESVTVIDVNLEFTNDLCNAKMSNKEDNSSVIVYTGDDSSNSGVSLLSEAAENRTNEGRSYQHVPYGEHISLTYKNESCCQTSEILSSTDSGFFTNENSGATSFVSNVSKNWEDVLLPVSNTAIDSYDGNTDQAINCDNYQDEICINERDMLSEQSVMVLDSCSQGTAATDDKSDGNDLEISNVAEISQTSQTDKQRNITNILMNGVQDLNSNCLRNMRNETGCVINLADTEDKVQCYRDPITGASCAQSPGKRQYLEQITTFETNSCGDGKTDIDKRQTSHQVLLNFDSYGEGESLQSDISIHMEPENMESSNNFAQKKELTWQNNNQCEIMNANDNETSDLSSMQESSQDLTNVTSDSYREDSYTCQSSLSEISEGQATKVMFISDNEFSLTQLCTEFKSNGKHTDVIVKGEKQQSGIDLETNSCDVISNIKSTEIDGSLETCVESEFSDWKLGVKFVDETNAENSICVLKEDFHETSQLSSRTENREYLSHLDITFSEENQQGRDISSVPYGDNCDNDENSYFPDIDNGSNMITTVSEENKLSVHHQSTGESISLLSTSNDSTCSQTDGRQILSTSHESKPQHEIFKDLHMSSAKDFNSECFPRKSIDVIDDTEQLKFTVCENLQSSNLLSTEGTNLSCNCSQLPESRHERSDCYISNNSKPHSGEIACQEIIGESALNDLHSEKLGKLSISQELIVPTSHDPKGQGLSKQLLSTEQHLTDFADLNKQTPETINFNFEEEDCLFSTDKRLGSNTRLAGNTQTTPESNFQATLRCNEQSTHAQNEYDFNKQMADRGSPLKTSENTLHSGVSPYDVGDQIKNDSASINMNENLKGSEINDLSSTIDSSESSTVYPSAEFARELNGSRGTCLKLSGDSTSTGVIEINNHIMHQDFFEDRVSSLSEVEHTTQKSSRNLQEYSEKISQPQECSSGDVEHENSKGYEQHLTSVDDEDTCNIISERWNNSQVSESLLDEVKSKIHVNSANYDTSGKKLQSLAEHCEICIESVSLSELDKPCGDYGLIHGVEIIPQCIKQTVLQHSVVSGINGEKCSCDFKQNCELKETVEIDQSDSNISELISGVKNQAVEITGDERRPYTFCGLDNKNTLIQLDENKQLTDTSSETDASQSDAICGLRCGFEQSFRFDNEKKLSDSLTHNLCSKLSDETDILQNDVSVTDQPSFQNDVDINFVGPGCSLECIRNDTGVLCEDRYFENQNEKFRKSSVDLEELRIRASELFNAGKSDQFKVIRNKNFESETESGESGSTESGSNTTEIEFGAGCILANAGEALCESLSPTEVASILDDTSDSYVDATDTLEYDTDGEIGSLNASLLPKDKRRSGDFNLYNVCDSTSTESFQDAVEAFEDGRHVLIRSPDILSRGINTLDDEDSLSQISLPLSDASSDSSTSVENLNIFDEFSDGFCQDEICSENMEPSGRNRLAAIRSNTITRSSLRHVQTSEYRTKTVLKDSHYRRVANGSWRIDRPSQVETNVLRSTDTDYESGNQIIKNVIYNTGNRIFHSMKISEHQTGASADFNCDGSKSILSEAKNSRDQKAIGEQLHLLEVNETLQYNKQFDSDSSDNQSSVTKENDSESSLTDDKAENPSVSPVPDGSENMSVSDANIGLKIETAVTIRTERRRQRQRRLKQSTDGAGGSVKIAIEKPSKPDTQSITQECVERLKQDNVVIYDSPEITLQNSSHITNESSSVSCVEESSSCRDENVDIETCKQREGQSVSILDTSEQSSVLCAMRQGPVESTLHHELKDELLEQPDLEKAIVSDDVELIQGVQNDKAVDDDRDEPDSVVTPGACSDHTGIVAESSKTEEKIKVTSRQGITSESKQEERTYTFYIKSGTDNDFDDIQFIDEEENGISIESKSTHDTKSDAPKEGHSPIKLDIGGQAISSPNASFTIEFSGDEDNNTCPSENDKINVSAAKSSSVNDDVLSHLQMESESKQNITKQDNPPQMSENENVSLSCRLLNDEKHEENKCEMKTHLQENKCTLNTTVGEVLDYDIVKGQTGIENAHETEETQSEIIEESNISVRDALKKEKINLGHPEEHNGFRRRISRNNVRRATTDNCIPGTSVRKSKSDEISHINNNRTVLKKSLSFRTEKECMDDEDQKALANKRVSNICRSFIDKLRPVPKSVDGEETIKSPTRQRKLMKWVRDNGKWLRVPVSEIRGREGIESGQDKFEYEDFVADLNTPIVNALFIPDDSSNTEQPDNGHNIASKENKTTTCTPESKEVSADNQDKSGHIVNSVLNTPDHANERLISSQLNTQEMKPTHANDNGITVEKKPCISEQALENNVYDEDNVNVTNDNQFEGRKSAYNTETVCKSLPAEHVKDDDEGHETQTNMLATQIKLTASRDIDTEEISEITDIADENAEIKAIDLSTNISEARLQRQELLFGIRDNYYRRKQKKAHSEASGVNRRSAINNDKRSVHERVGSFVHAHEKLRHNEQSRDEKKHEDTLQEYPEIPKTIPKLKAVKIQEEIFEGNPEYMKECNKKPAWSETDSEQVKHDGVPNYETKPRSVQIRKSKTFSGIGDFEQKPRECIYVTSSSLSESNMSMNASQESLELPETLGINRTGSVIQIDTIEDSGSMEGSKKKDQGTSKIPWYSSKKDRRSREKEKSTDKTTTTAHIAVETTVAAPPKPEKKRLKLPVFSRAKSLQRPKLLSEIVEVEENKDDIPQNSNAKQSTTVGPRNDTKSCKTVPRSNKRRSLSLPTGTLAFGEARIVYKNGHFTIETMDGTEIDSSRPPDPRLERQYSHTQVNTMLVTSDSREINPNSSTARETTRAQRHHMKRQCAKSYLNRTDSSEDVFYDEDEEIENISPNSSVHERAALRAARMGQLNKTAIINGDPNSSQMSETSLECSVIDRMEIDTESDKSLSDRSSSSLSSVTMSEEVVREAQRAKRTSSFRRAQQSGALFLMEKSTDIETENQAESQQRRNSTEDDQNSDLAQSNSTFLQKMMGKRKSLNENLGMSNFSKQSESAKEFFAKKMTLKGLFKKNKSESSVSSPLKTQHPVSPPIAAFQGDDDIGSIDTPPGSPFAQHDSRRRHTSADVYIRSFADGNETGDSNCPTPTQERSSIGRQSLSSPSTPSHETNSLTSNTSSCALSSREEDQISITSASSATSSVYSVHSPVPLEQPNKPKTPKPVGASPRRNPSYSSHLSRTGSVASQREAYNSVTSLESENLDGDEVIECKCECDRKVATLPRQRRFSETTTRGSSDSLMMCPYCKQVSGYSENVSGSNFRKLRKRSTSSTRHASSSDANTLQRKDSGGRTSYDKIGIISQTDIASSNSNDSGIQRDGGVNSSNESIKGIPDGPITLRRRKSASPQPERPKSEVGVRWADLDTPDYDEPVRMRRRDQSKIDRPRPKSDFEGSSFLSDRMKVFGSEVNLQPYCSLRNLYEMRRRDMDKPKNRRMSTPHPIKSRMQRAPKKLQKQLPLVRSSSMPESLEKIHKRRKINHLFDLHVESLNRHIDMEEFMSDDSDLSFDNTSLQEKSVSVQSSHSQLTSMDEEEDNLIYAEALWDHITMDPEELGFRAQDVIKVYDMSDKDWWFGVIDEREGWIPAAFVRLRVNQDQIEEDLDVTLQENLTTSPKLRRISMLNKNQARTNVVNEIISAEREYVKHLKDVVEGYIQHARKRKEMFSDDRVRLIFGNIEDIYKFACKFLAQLETCIDVCPHLSEIGQCFIDNDKGFEIYSDYCNNHPSACEELKELCRDSKYKHFFEACRLLQDLVEIPLEGFLLTPVQKICKYPLQLAELLKYTPPDHPDYNKVKDALAAMRKIATLINERKRKMESIEKIAVWQHSVVDWEGSDLLERSSELIFSGDLYKINTAGWSQERYFFLFDHQLIYCKKELLKRHVFSYKGRIDLDQCKVVDILDGKDFQYNVTVKHAWKLHETTKDKWYLLYTKSAAAKERWLKALKDERKRVQEDQENDYCMPDHWKQTVLNKVRSQSNIKDKQQSSRGYLGPSLGHHKDYKDFTYSTLPRRPQKQDKKKGWFNFGGGKKSKR